MTLTDQTTKSLYFDRIIDCYNVGNIKEAEKLVIQLKTSTTTVFIIATPMVNSLSITTSHVPMPLAVVLPHLPCTVSTAIMYTAPIVQQLTTRITSTICLARVCL